MSAIAADAHAHGARGAAFTLRQPHGVQNALANAFQVAVGAAQMGQFAWHGILVVGVLAAAAFENEFDLDLLLLPLLKVNHRRFHPEVVAAVFPGDGIHRVRAQLAQPGGFRNGFANGSFDADLVHAHRRVDHERRHAGILTDRAGVVVCHIDVAQNNIEGLRGLRSGRFAAGRNGHRGAHVRGQIGRGLGDQLQQAGG